jgi:hypothetical protein
MDSQQRKLLILVALLGAWGLLFVFRAPWATPPKLEARAVAPARRAAAQGGGLPRLKRELLDLPSPAHPAEVHNIFAPPPPPPPPVQAAVTPVPAGPPPPDPFQEEAKRLRYVGFLQAGDAAMAFIVHGPEVHTVEVGATLLGRFRVQSVTEDAVHLSSVTGDEQVRLPLSPDAGAAPKR